jgi:hypothetical protein
MIKQVLYKYLGTNGVIESPVHLEDIYYIRINVLTADEGKILTNGSEKRKQVRCSDDEVADWREVTQKGQK